MIQQAIKKIVIIGPESTGKSTLSQGLVEALSCEWVPEFARAYLELQGNHYDYDDLLEIAKGQLDTEEKAIKRAGAYLICDTDLYVIKVWSEHKYNKVHPFILETIAERHYDAYILCDIDMPWESDPQREHPDPTMRLYFFSLYRDIVQESGCPFVLVKGTAEERLKQALSFISGMQ